MIMVIIEIPAAVVYEILKDQLYLYKFLIEITTNLDQYLLEEMQKGCHKESKDNNAEFCHDVRKYYDNDPHAQIILYLNSLELDMRICLCCITVS